MTTKPISVGFGIFTAEHVKTLHDHVDGVIVGNRVIQAVCDGENLSELVTQLKTATKR